MLSWNHKMVSKYSQFPWPFLFNVGFTVVTVEMVFVAQYSLAVAAIIGLLAIAIALAWNDARRS